MQHTIDDGRKLICTVWTGEADDDGFIAALVRYQNEIKSRPEYRHYDEILDLCGITSFNLTSGGLRRLSEIGAKTDIHDGRTRLAIVVTQPFGYGLARMYLTYRSFIPAASKELRIFRDSVDAMEWIGENQGTLTK